MNYISPSFYSALTEQSHRLSQMILHSMQNALFFSKRKRNLTLPLHYPSFLRWTVSHQQKKYLVITSPRYAGCTRLSGISLLVKRREPKLRLPSHPWPGQAKGGGTTNIPKVKQTCSYGWILGVESDTREKNTFFMLLLEFSAKAKGKKKQQTNKNQTFLKFLVIVHCSG